MWAIVFTELYEFHSLKIKEEEKKNETEKEVDDGNSSDATSCKTHHYMHNDTHTRKENAKDILHRKHCHRVMRPRKQKFIFKLCISTCWCIDDDDDDDNVSDGFVRTTFAIQTKCWRHDYRTYGKLCLCENTQISFFFLPTQTAHTTYCTI